jgi:hypothetical protein
MWTIGSPAPDEIGCQLHVLQVLMKPDTTTHTVSIGMALSLVFADSSRMQSHACASQDDTRLARLLKMALVFV